MKLFSFVPVLTIASKHRGCNPADLNNLLSQYEITSDCKRNKGFHEKPNKDGIFLEKPGNYCRRKLKCEFDIPNSTSHLILCRCTGDECGYVVKYTGDRGPNRWQDVPIPNWHMRKDVHFFIYD